MKRFLAILAVCALAFSLCAPVEAKTAKAATMRLEKTQGTVTLKSGAGKTLTQSDGMKLYSGNSLADAAKSYAWVSLDSSKAVKLGASSSVTVKQSGKKLELNLTSGKLFFDVKTPLTSDESLSIRTSTTVTGIRGTCGVVEAIKDSETGEDCTRVTIFEGSVVVTTAEPAAGTTNTLTVSAGKWMQIASDNGRVVHGTIDDTSDLGFAMVDIAADPALLARINAATVLGEKIKTTAAKQLAIDEGDEQKAIDALPANKIVVTDPVFSEPVYVGGGGVPAQTSKTLTMADFTNGTDDQTTAKLQSALNSYDIVNLNLGPNSSLTVAYAASGLEIPSNKTLNLETGSLSLMSGGATVNGTVNILAGANFTNSATLTNNSSNSIHNAGTFTNVDRLVNNQNGLFENTGTLAITSGSVTNSGNIKNSGTINNSGNINIDRTANAGATITFGGTGKLINTGDGSVIINNGSANYDSLDYGSDACGYLLETTDGDASNSTYSRVSDLVSTMSDSTSTATSREIHLLKDVTLTSAVTIAKNLILTGQDGSSRKIKFTPTTDTTDAPFTAVTVSDSKGITINNSVSLIINNGSEKSTVLKLGTGSGLTLTNSHLDNKNGISLLTGDKYNICLNPNSTLTAKTDEKIWSMGSSSHILTNTTYFSKTSAQTDAYVTYTIINTYTENPS